MFECRFEAMENRLEAGTYNSNTTASGAASDGEFIFFGLFSLMLHGN